MKRSKVSIAVMMCMILATGFITAYAESMIEPMYTYINGFTATISSSQNAVQCIGEAKGIRSDTTTRITMTLQGREDGTSTWLPIKSWSTSTSGKAYARLNKSQAISSGYDYRVSVRCIISDSEGVVLESGTKYSTIVSVP